MNKKAHIIRMNSWEKIIMEANNSDMTKMKWCRLHNIKLRQFYYWQKKVRDHLQEYPEASLPGLQNPDSSYENTDVQQVFYEVSLMQETSPAPLCETACEVNQSLPVAPVSGPASPNTINEHPSTHHPLMLQYDRFQLFIDDGISENTLSSVIRVIKNA